MIDTTFEISGNIVDLFARRTYPGTVIVKNGVILEIVETADVPDQYILPGLIDAHIHIESSMLVPTEFARLAVAHGTVAAVCDPHEIANVVGLPGVEYMYANSNLSPFKFYFGAPSCVPATPFETAGAAITPDDIEYLFTKRNFKFLCEMMNVPGVLNGVPEVLQKLEIAKKHGRPIDGHSPALTDPEAGQYISAGIGTDHECISRDEARTKISHGMKIQLREGSAAKNFNDLLPLIDEFPDYCMLCSDDKHPDDLVKGHINKLVHRGLKAGADLYNLLQAACVNPVEHYVLEVGLLRRGDPADFIVVDGWKNFNVLQTWIDGKLVADDGQSLIDPPPFDVINNFNCTPKAIEDFSIKPDGRQIKVIDIIPGQLVTDVFTAKPNIVDNNCTADPQNDILKLTVVNRYQDSPPAVGFVHGFGLCAGALASSVAHDSHNIVAVGTNDAELQIAVNIVIAKGGGVAVVSDGKATILPLPVAGVMSVDDGCAVAEKYSKLDRMAKELGSDLPAPFMTLSFLALLVIPKLKLSDRGLFDGEKFEFTSVFV